MKIGQEFTGECAHDVDEFSAYSGQLASEDGHVELVSLQRVTGGEGLRAAIHLGRDEAIRLARWLLDVCEEA